MAIARKLPIGYYVYTITVDGVVRYIGKGKGLRLYCHMKEVRNRLNRDYRLQNIGSRLQQNLTKAVLSGAKVIERVLVDNLTETAYWAHKTRLRLPSSCRPIFRPNRLKRTPFYEAFFGPENPLTPSSQQSPRELGIWRPVRASRRGC